MITVCASLPLPPVPESLWLIARTVGGSCTESVIEGDGGDVHSNRRAVSSEQVEVRCPGKSLTVWLDHEGGRVHLLVDKASVVLISRIRAHPLVEFLSGRSVWRQLA